MSLESWDVVMRVVDGIASLPWFGSVDAIFQPQPHGAIAVNPLNPRMSPRHKARKGPHRFLART